LPGFHEKIPALNNISLESYGKYIDKQIAKLKLKHYVICGISFGFETVNRAKLSKACKGVIGIEPCLNSESLNMSWIKKEYLKIIINSIIRLNLYPHVWNADWLRSMGIKNPGIVLEHMNRFAFFKTAKLIFNNKEIPKFHSLPYVLVINENDWVIKPEYVEEIFKKKIKRCKIVKTPISHYPNDLSKAYFKRNLPDATLQEIANFLDKNNP
jgi:hypothetical protein